ncbi:cell division protein ZapB [Desulfuromonas sp. CSMB_57]|uniref:cell division protein ZapB n=1 Tax=Desulfuromonas sp. CSMB_57 TaxID=2807629 RepID=UPI001CD2A281
MDLSVILHLEEKVDLLLARKRELEEECQRLGAERDRLLQEREQFLAELDRVLSKLDGLGEELA